MARQTKRLSARSVATITKPGRHADGEGLYLVVDPSDAKRWLFLFRWGGKLKEMGLGGLGAVSLAEAREKAAEARRVLAGGKNPIDERRAAEAVREAAATFGAFADSIVASLSPGFRNAKHRQQWKSSWPPMRCRCATRRSTRSTPRTCSRSLNPSGRPRLRPRRGCAAGSSACS